MSGLIGAEAVVAAVLAGEVVHVMGPREDGPDYGPDEGVCEPCVEHGLVPEDPVRVVYHPASLKVDGVWVCPACGEGPPPHRPRLAS